MLRRCDSTVFSEMLSAAAISLFGAPGREPAQHRKLARRQALGRRAAAWTPPASFAATDGAKYEPPAATVWIAVRSSSTPTSFSR